MLMGVVVGRWLVELAAMPTPPPRAAARTAATQPSGHAATRPGSMETAFFSALACSRCSFVVGSRFFQKQYRSCMLRVVGVVAVPGVVCGRGSRRLGVNRRRSRTGQVYFWGVVRAAQRGPQHAAQADPQVGGIVQNRSLGASKGIEPIFSYAQAHSAPAPVPLRSRSAPAPLPLRLRTRPRNERTRGPNVGAALGCLLGCLGICGR